MHEACWTWQDQSPVASVLIHQGYHLLPWQFCKLWRPINTFTMRAGRSALDSSLVSKRAQRAAVLVCAWLRMEKRGKLAGEVLLRVIVAGPQARIGWGEAFFLSFSLCFCFFYFTDVFPIVVRIKSHKLNIKRTSENIHLKVRFPSGEPSQLNLYSSDWWLIHIHSSKQSLNEMRRRYWDFLLLVDFCLKLSA